MESKKFLLIASLLLAACTADPIAEGAGDEAAGGVPAAKIVNTSTDAAQGRILVCFDDQAIESIENLATRAAGDELLTRSGITSVDDVLGRLDISSLHRVFPRNPKTEERTRAAGLHKWYVLNFDSEASLDKAAAELAAVSQVSRVQFDSKLHKASDCKVTPFMENAVPATRANTQAGAVFNDPNLASQWHYINNGNKSFAPTTRAGADINVAEAWKLIGGSSSIVVAIVDEGVKYNHPDLAANMWVNTSEQNGAANNDNDGNGYKNDIYGYNFAKHSSTFTWSETYINDKGKKDGDVGHGTHVAGTVAAVNNNGQGVCGVAGGTGRGDGVRLMSCQIFSGAAGGSVSVSAEAIKYAADNGASILQCSWGYPGGAIKSDDAYAKNKNYSIEKEAIDYFIATKNNDVVDGGIVIFAAGNDATAWAGYPAAYRDYIAVTSFSPDYLPAYYTNYDKGCNIAAPGGDYFISPDQSSSNVLSTVPTELYPGDYGYMQGTSMACPHVSGVAALGLAYAQAKGKQYTLDEFNSMLLSSVNDIDTYLDGTKKGAFGTMQLRNYHKKMGTGAIDAYQLLMQIEGTPCLKAKVGTSQLVSLNQFFGGGSSNLTYIGVEMSADEQAKIGLSKVPEISYGKLKLECTKTGVARITIKAIAGGSSLGTGGETGGREITKEFAIIARGVQTTNGGWL